MFGALPGAWGTVPCVGHQAGKNGYFQPEVFWLRGLILQARIIAFAIEIHLGESQMMQINFVLEQNGRGAVSVVYTSLHVAG